MFADLPPAPPAAVVQAAAEAAPAQGVSPTSLPPDRQQVKDAVWRAAVQYGVEPNVALAVSWQESRWRHHGVTSGDGAIGAMQCMPQTASWLSSKTGRPLDLDRLDDNAACGALNLESLLERTDGDLRASLAGYYQGLASVNTRGWYDDTERYVDSVLAYRAILDTGAIPDD